MVALPLIYMKRPQLRCYPCRPFHSVKNGRSEDKLPTVFQGPFPEEMGGEGGDEADECVGLPPYWQRQQ